MYISVKTALILYTEESWHFIRNNKFHSILARKYMELLYTIKKVILNYKFILNKLPYLKRKK